MANEIVKIGNQAVEAVEYRGQRVVTFAMVDRLHRRADGTAKRNFFENRERFIDGEDCYLIGFNQKYEIRGDSIEVPPRGLTVLTESGYLMIVKSMTDDVSWQVQRKLVQSYFKVRAASMALPDLNDPTVLLPLLIENTSKVLQLQAEVAVMEPKAKFYDSVATADGTQSLQEVSKILGIGTTTLFRRLRELKILMHGNVPLQAHIDAGRFRVVQRWWKDDDEQTHLYTRTLVTGKGLAYIQRKLVEGTELEAISV